MITVILADDHTVLRDGLRYLLEAAGDIKILSMAANGQEAVEQAILHCPDVVVLDITTPYMSSYEVYRQLKSTRQARQPAVLMYSNKTDSYKWSQGSRLGADAYLSKLCRPQELVDTVKQLLLKQPAFQA